MDAINTVFEFAAHVFQWVGLIILAGLVIALAIYTLDD